MKKLVIVGLAVAGTLLVLLVLPSGGGDHYHGRPATLALNSCVNNLRLLDGAKQQWALEKHKGTNDVPTMADLVPYMPHVSFSQTSCPAGASIPYKEFGTLPRAA